MRTIFSCDNVCLAYGKDPVLQHLTFELEPERVTVLLGRNGAGKSTLMKCALGVLETNSGTMRVLDHDPMKRPRPARERLGYVPDRPDVYGWMRIRDLFRFLKPQYPTWNVDRAEHLIDAFGVPRQRTFARMSRGEGTKAMLAAALAPDPELLLLDEPFAGLDPIAREDVLRHVIGELRTEGQTVLCATHELDVAARIADRVAILDGGRIVEHGAVEVILEGHEPARLPTRLQERFQQLATAEA